MDMKRCPMCGQLGEVTEEYEDGEGINVGTVRTVKCPTHGLTRYKTFEFADAAEYEAYKAELEAEKAKKEMDDDHL